VPPVAVISYQGRTVARSGEAGNVLVTHAPGTPAQPLVLDSSASTPGEGTQIFFRAWDVAGASAVTTEVTCAFTADREYVVTLAVQDDADGQSEPATLTISVKTDGRNWRGRGRLMGGVR